MNTSVADSIVQDYLTRLRVALAGNPPDQQREVLAEVESHIASARAEAPEGEAGVRTVLERLGDPAEIAAAAGLPPTPVPPPRRTTEIVGLLFLLLGGFFIPFVGWFVGLVLLWTSRVWTTRDKLLGTLVIPGGLGTVPWLLLVPTTTVSADAVQRGPGDPASVALLAALIIAPLITMFVLARRLARPA